MFEPPACDRGVIAAQENLGNRTAAVDARAGVLGIFESSIRAERFVDGALVIPEHTGDQPHDRVDQDHRGDFASGEDIVAHRDQLRLEDFDDAFIETLVTTTQAESVEVPGPARRPPLIEPATLRREHDQASRRLGGRSHGLGRRHHRRGHQDHSRPAAERPIIDLLVLPLGPGANVPSLDLTSPFRSPD